MYKVAKIIYKCKTNKKQGRIYNDVLNMLTALFYNGQIREDFVVEEYEDKHVAHVTTIGLEALNEEYCNKDYKRIVEDYDVEIEFFPSAISEKICTCKTCSFYLIEYSIHIESSPILCGDCSRPVPLYKIPYFKKEVDHYTLITYRKMYDNIFTLWIDGLHDSFTKKQMTDYRSSLNKAGLKLRKELEKLTNIPVYFSLHNPLGCYYKFTFNNRNLKRCPSCKGKFSPIKHEYVDKICPKCKMAFATSAEDEGPVIIASNPNKTL